MTTVTIFGNQQIAVDILRYLIKKKNVTIKAFVGCETASDLSFGYPSLKAFCEENDIIYIDSETFFKNFLSFSKKYKADIYLSIYFRKIFSKQHLVSLREIINIHPSLLPKYRGPSPTLWALLNNEKFVGVTIHYIDQNVDTGDIIAQKKIKISKNITGFELNNLVMSHGVALFKKVFPQIIKGSHTRLPQDESGFSYFGKFYPEYRKIDWFQGSQSIMNKVRALTHPYEGAITFFKGIPITMWSAKVVSTKSSHFGPGKVIAVTKKFITVTTIDGALMISYTQENLKAINIKVGDKLDISY